MRALVPFPVRELLARVERERVQANVVDRSAIIRRFAERTTTICIVLLNLLFADTARLLADDPVFDVPALIATPLNSRTLKSYERDGVVTEEVRFHSEKDGDKEVDIFAYFSYPKGAQRLPAYIWNPGGLGQASPGYTEPGALRGYAVLCIDFPQPGYRSTGDYPINTGLLLPEDPRQAPIYHGAVALLKAVSYLESRNEVDKDRIGMAGSSWGGFFTTLMTGLDPRLKVGSCMYGCGNLQLGNAWWDGDSMNGRPAPSVAERERWRTTLDPGWRLTTKKTPIAWFTTTNDRFYPLPAVMKSYEMAAGPKHLMLVPNWDHAMPQRLTDEAFMSWLDLHLQGKQNVTTLSAANVRKENERLIVSWEFEGDISTAELIASYGEAGNWKGRYWHTIEATIDGRVCRAELPPATIPCFVSGNTVNHQGLRSSTPLLLVDSGALGVKAAILVPDYDGCREWGGFEEAHIAYLTRHDRSGQKRWLPKLSSDAVQGMHSAILEPNRTVLPPILSTANVPHRFACSLKADRPVTVMVQLANEQRPFEIGMKWTEIQLDHTPPLGLLGGTVATITIPPESKVIVDEITFRPRPEQ